VDAVGTTTLAERLGREGRDELTPEETRKLIDEQARKYLDMSFEEFIERAKAGTLPDEPVVAHLALLAGVDVGSC
jgi:hypothetical protein